MKVTVRLLLGAGVCATGLLCSCGESQEASPPFNRGLGGSSLGAPLVRDVADPGILQDPATYQPARAAGMPGPRGKKGGAGAVAGDADTQIRTAVHDLLSAINDGEIELALKSFNPEHVKALSEDKYDVLFATVDKFGTLKATAEKKLDKAKVEALTAAFRGLGGGEPKIDKLDDEHATVTPNLARFLFGPVKMTPSMAIAKTPEGWKFQLDSPLTAADVEAVLAFHKKLQEALDKVIDWVNTQETVDAAQLQAAVVQALAGQPVDLGTGEKKAEPTPEPAPTPVPEGGRGRVAPPPGRGGRQAPPGGGDDSGGG